MSDSYYKTIDGKHYDREMLEIADEAVAGAGDGRISVEAAHRFYYREGFKDVAYKEKGDDGISEIKFEWYA